MGNGNESVQVIAYDDAVERLQLARSGGYFAGRA